MTGSARLDFYRFGGDSLQGRYHYLRLHPLSVAELGISTAADLETLLVLGGFPEPFLDGSAAEARRWSNEYRTRLVREDLVSLEQVQDLGSLKWLNFREDAKGYRTELRYFRDIEGREVDFVALEDGKPVLFVECKSSNRDVSTALRYLKARFPGTAAWQICPGDSADYVTREGIRVAPAVKLLATLV